MQVIKLAFAFMSLMNVEKQSEEEMDKEKFRD